jgi:hypothetical protein
MHESLGTGAGSNRSAEHLSGKTPSNKHHTVYCAFHFATNQAIYSAVVFRLDYISCLLTVLSTILIGRRAWYGWIVAGANSVLICIIGSKTGQFGFIPANLFCLAIYGYNILQWRAHDQGTVSISKPAAAHRYGSRGLGRVRRVERPIRPANPNRTKRIRRSPELHSPS